MVSPYEFNNCIIKEIKNEIKEAEESLEKHLASVAQKFMAKKRKRENANSKELATVETNSSESEENIYEDTMKMIVSRIEKNMKLKVPEMEIGLIVFSKEYGLLGESDNAKELLNRIKEQ